MENVPGVYADVSKSRCFIDYATRCMLGQHMNYYGMSKNCKNWAKDTYCRVEEKIDKLKQIIKDVSMNVFLNFPPYIVCLIGRLL